MRHVLPRCMRHGILLFAAGAAGSCGDSRAAGPGELVLRGFTPQIKHNVFLNEELSFHFSGDVDPASVNSESVVVQTLGGERAQGRLRVEGRRIVFRPDGPRARDLADGGFRPGTSYSVRLVGFPRPDGIRSLGGEPLGRTYCDTFTTVAFDETQDSLLFDDPHQERHKPPGLFPPGSAPTAPYAVGAGDPIYVACEKPIDPRSVRGEDWRLSLASAPSVATDIAVFARLVENEADPEFRPRPSGVRSLQPSEAWRSERRAALIELMPARPLAPGETRVLRYEPQGGYSLRDFSRGALIEKPRSFSERVIEVVAGLGSTQEELVEDFLAPDLRTPLVVPGCDGTACWDASGRVEVCYPLAAGDGRLGAQSLGDALPSSDVQATEIDLAPDQICRLGEGAGLVLLRAQGRLTLRGRLVRSAPAVEALDLAAERGARLSDWLARERERNPSWTVLIAGGDLVIEPGAVLESSVPVLLLAGGQIRIAGTLALPSGGKTLWMQAGAGGPSALASQGQMSAQFLLDPPSGTNPLRKPLRYGVVSGPLPPTGRVARWVSAEASGWLGPRATSGVLPPRAPNASGTPSSWSVRYLDAEEPEIALNRAVASPVFLPRPGAVRFVVELVVGDGPLWQPPFVDRVRLSYSQTPR